MKSIRFYIIGLALAGTWLACHKPVKPTISENIVSYFIDPKQADLRFFLKDDKGRYFGNIGNLKKWLAEKNEGLFFAMNGGMYKPDQSPLGLYIEKSVMISKLDTSSGSGNFYMKPNGVFYVTDAGKADVVLTQNYSHSSNIKYATQSGPMLLINEQINPEFQENSTNLNIRNGVGILPDGDVMFAISISRVNFYMFANYFKHAGCVNALYLDGVVSRAYIPERELYQTDGKLGVIMGVIAPKK